MLNSLLGLYFEVFHAANTDSRYGGDDDKRLVNLRPIASFSNYQLTSSIGKHIEDTDHAHIACLMYKLTISSKDIDDFSIEFDRDRKKNKKS